jgi:hypothetical protein
MSCTTGPMTSGRLVLTPGIASEEAGANGIRSRFRKRCNSSETRVHPQECRLETVRERTVQAIASAPLSRSMASLPRERYTAICF